MLVRESIKSEILHNPHLVGACGVDFRPAQASDASILASRYCQAYSRGDFFAARYQDPDQQVFNPDWFREEVEKPDRLWIVFHQGEEFLGSTALFGNGDEVWDEVCIDETQIGLNGRGLKIMDHYFRRIVPLLESYNLDILTEFVLTPESKGLRKTLQGELGLAALGIHPFNLKNRQLGFLESEISAAKYHHLTAEQAVILPPFVPILEIVREQLGLPEAIVIARGYLAPVRGQVDEYEEATVSDVDLGEQYSACLEGYLPVAYNPKDHQFTVARFPSMVPKLDFMMAEDIEPNKQLVDYLLASARQEQVSGV